jgi:hypothetical protein
MAVTAIQGCNCSAFLHAFSGGTLLQQGYVLLLQQSSVIYLITPAAKKQLNQAPESQLLPVLDAMTVSADPFNDAASCLDVCQHFLNDQMDLCSMLCRLVLGMGMQRWEDPQSAGGSGCTPSCIKPHYKLSNTVCVPRSLLQHWKHMRLCLVHLENR